MKSWKKIRVQNKVLLGKAGFKAERVPLSGALGIVSSALKSDVVAEKGRIRLRIDAKDTLSKDKIIPQKETMEKIEEEAEEGEVPLVVFSFYNHRILYALIKKELLNYQGKIHEKKGWKNREKYIKGMLELKEKKEVAPEEFFEMIQEYYAGRG